MSAIFGQAKPLILWPDMSAGSAIVTATTAFRAADGSAATPSYSFTADSDTGFYRVGSGEVGFSSNGVLGMTFVGGSIYGPDRTANITFSSGAINLTASGTNQNITLTPSGTGFIAVPLNTNISLNGATGTQIFRGTSGLTQNGIRIQGDANGPGFLTGNLGVAIGTKADGTAAIPSGGLLVSGHVLLGGLTTDGTGVIQLAAATTSAGGITFGTDTNLFRSAGGELTINRVGASGTGINFQENGTTTGGFLVSSGSLIFRSNGTTTALTLDTSQNATFAGFVRPVNLATASAPTYAKGVIYFDTTLNKLRVGGATAFETITSA